MLWIWYWIFTLTPLIFQSKTPRAEHQGIFLGYLPRDGKTIKLNGTVYTLCTILKFVALYASEAELGAIVLNVKEARIMQLTLNELGHTQPPTPIHFDNATTAIIANSTVKKQRSTSMEMRYFYVCDQVKNGVVDILWLQVKRTWDVTQVNIITYPITNRSVCTYSTRKTHDGSSQEIWIRVLCEGLLVLY